MAIRLGYRKPQPRLLSGFLSPVPANPHRQPGRPDPPAFLEDPPKIAFPVQPLVPPKPLIQMGLLGSKPPTAFMPAAFQHAAPARRLHLGSKSVYFGAMAHIRLIGTFRHCGGDYTTGGRSLLRKSTISLLSSPNVAIGIHLAVNANDGFPLTAAGMTLKEEALVKKKTRSKAKPKAAKKTKTRKPVKAKAKVKKSSAQRPPVKASKKTKKAKKAKKASAPPARPSLIAPVGGVLLGFVDDYFAKIGVIALTLKASVVLGQKIQVLGHTTNFEQMVDSMQIEHAPVTQAGLNDSVGIKVINRARSGDHVYLLK